jgi:hypothetical protein
MLLDLELGFLDAFGNFHLLFAGEQGDLAHLLQIHAHRVIEHIEPALFLFLRRCFPGLIDLSLRPRSRFPSRGAW